MKIAHQILVIVVEDKLLCLVGTWLGAIVPGQRLSGTANKISIAITLSSCILQYIMALHKSCMYFKTLKRQPRGCGKCSKSKMECYGIWLFVLLATGALSLACTKAIYVFYATNVDTNEVDVYVYLFCPFIPLSIFSIMILFSIQWCCCT